jgi:amidase
MEGYYWLTMTTLDPWIEATELRELVVKKEVSPREVADFFLARIERLNPRFNAFMTVTSAQAYDDADRLQSIGANAGILPLYGVPYSIKDLTPTKGVRTTMGSRNYENFVPDQDAAIVKRMREAGGIMLGKTTTPEFGGRPTTEGGLCPPARNPWNPAHTAGGSSGGAGTALAAGMHPLAEGSDGGGSIRIPSACCGVVGLKPSRSRISFAPFYGEQWAGMATSGPMARSVADAALMLDVISAPITGDPYCAPSAQGSFLAAAKLRPKKLRLAVIVESSLGPTDSEVRAAFEKACETFRLMGHTIIPIELDPAAMLRDSFMTVVSACVASVAIPQPELMDPLLRTVWLEGQQISAARYINTLTELHNTSRQIIEMLSPYDALLTPTLPRPAVTLGSLPSTPDNAPAEFLAWLPFTFPFNATGQPAFSLPNERTRAGLPIGLQIVGRPYDEAGIIGLAASLEEARPWRGDHPALE